jgi:excisionase family DNA binding protein
VDLVKATETESLPALIGRLAEAQAIAQVRLVQPVGGNGCGEDRNLLDVEAVAARLSIPVTKVYDLVKAKHLPAVRIGKYLRIRQEDLDDYLAQRCGPGKNPVKVDPPSRGPSRPTVDRHLADRASEVQPEDVRLERGRRSPGSTPKLLEAGQPLPPPDVSASITVREYAKVWLDAVRGGLKPRTVQSYEQLLRLYIYPAFGSVAVKDLTPRTIAGFLAGLLQVGKLSVVSVRMVYAVFRRLCSRAVFDGAIRVNPAAAVWDELPVPRAARTMSKRRDRNEVPAMTETQLTAFLRAAAQDQRHHALFLLRARTGLRPNEALALKIADVDLQARELLVAASLAPATKAGVPLEKRLGTPKSDKPRFTVVSTQAVEALRRQILRRRTQNLKLGLDEGRSPWLFATVTGTPLDESAVNAAFRAALRRAGLPLRFTPYSLRHTWATLMLSKGAPLVWVSQQLGHSTPSTTMDWYWWALPDGTLQHADLLDGKPTTTSHDQEAAVGQHDDGQLPSPQHLHGAGARD